MIDVTSPVYRLAESIARAELQRGLDENRVKSPDAFLRKVRDNLLERVEQRGTPWLVEQGLRFGVDIPVELEAHKPTRDEINARKPALCKTCGIALSYDPVRSVTMIEGWPFATKLCARGNNEETECRTYQERSELGLIRREWVGMHG